MQITMNKPPLMLGIREAAAHFGISQHYCRQLALSGTVKAVRVGRGKILLNVDSLTAYFNNATIPDQMDKTAYPSDIRPIPVKI